MKNDFPIYKLKFLFYDRGKIILHEIVEKDSRGKRKLQREIPWLEVF